MGRIRGRVTPHPSIGRRCPALPRYAPESFVKGFVKGCRKKRNTLSENPSMGSMKTPGPVTQRRCTDVFFLLLFVAFWCGMFGIFIKAVTSGDLRQLYMPSDVYGNICGLDNTKKFAKGQIYDFDSGAADDQINCNTRDIWTPALTDTMKEACDARMDMT